MTPTRGTARRALVAVIVAGASLNLVGSGTALASSEQCIGAGTGPYEYVQVCVNGTVSTPEIRSDCNGACTSVYLSRGGSATITISQGMVTGEPPLGGPIQQTVVLGAVQDMCIVSVGVTASNRSCLLWVGP
jgi:hypothetical protein